MDEFVVRPDREALRIRQEMDDTRAALADKLDELGHQVTDTVSSVTHTVDAVKHAFDVAERVRERPWIAVAGAAAIGLYLGYRTSAHDARRRAAGTVRPVVPSNPAPPPANGATASPWTEVFSEEIALLRGLAIGALFGVVRDWVTPSVPQTLERSVVDAIDGVTVKLGGQPLQGSWKPRGRPGDPARPMNASPPHESVPSRPPWT